MEEIKNSKEGISEAEIVKLSPDDWERIRDLRVRAVTDSPYAFGQNPDEAASVDEKEWRSRLERREYIFAKRGEELLGMVCAVPEKNSKTKHVAYVYSVYVAPEERGKGTGRKLMESLIDDVKHRFPDVIKLELNVATTQPEALALYESLGFKKIGLLEKELYVNGEYIDEWMMSLFIGEVAK